MDMNFSIHKEKDNKEMTSYTYGWTGKKVGLTLKVSYRKRKGTDKR